MRRLTLVLIIGLTSCYEKDNSELRHVPGDLSRPAAHSYERCEQDDYALSLEDTDEAGLLKNMQRTISRYLRDIATEIMERTNESLVSDGSPPIFVDDLAPELFCFRTQPVVNAAVNASADTRRREIEFLAANFLTFPDEASIAGILCHEIAHISMAHTDANADLRPDIKRLIDNDLDFAAKFPAAMAQCDVIGDEFSLPLDLVERIFGRDTPTYHKIKTLQLESEAFTGARFMKILFGNPLNSVTGAVYMCNVKAEFYAALRPALAMTGISDKLREEDNRIWNRVKNELQSIIVSQEVSDPELSKHAALSFFQKYASFLDKAHDSGRYGYINWREQEADEVGYEICLRSGVEMKKLESMHRLMLERSGLAGDNLNKCLATMDSDEVPDRSTSSYPSDCWRLYNLRIREPQNHKDYYNDLLDRLPRRSLFGEERLIEVLETIHAVK